MDMAEFAFLMRPGLINPSELCLPRARRLHLFRGGVAFQDRPRDQAKLCLGFTAVTLVQVAFALLVSTDVTRMSMKSIKAMDIMAPKSRPHKAGLLLRNKS